MLIDLLFAVVLQAHAAENPKKPADQLALADELWKDPKKRRESVVAYQTYTKLTPEKIPSGRVLERCVACGYYGELAKGTPPSPALTGRWKAIEVKCTEGPLQTFVKNYNTELAAKSGAQRSEELEISASGDVIGKRSANIDGKIAKDVYQYHVSLIGDRWFEQMMSHGKKSVDGTQPHVEDTVRKYEVKKDGDSWLLTLTSLDPIRSSNFCTKGHSLWKYKKQ
ncbi:MAG: hypothetical protein V4760_14985 [Bdellovibrionota bacterium]